MRRQTSPGFWPAASPNCSSTRPNWTPSSTPLENNCATRNQAVQEMESEHAERAQRASAIDGEAKQARERLNHLHLELDRGAARIRNNDERCAELDARSAGAQAEITQTTEQLARLQEEVAGNQQVLESAGRRCSRRPDRTAPAAAGGAERDDRSATGGAGAGAASSCNHGRRLCRLETCANRITQAEERIAALEARGASFGGRTRGSQSAG